MSKYVGRTDMGSAEREPITGVWRRSDPLPTPPPVKVIGFVSISGATCSKSGVDMRRYCIAQKRYKHVPFYFQSDYSPCLEFPIIHITFRNKRTSYQYFCNDKHFTARQKCFVDSTRITKLFDKYKKNNNIQHRIWKVFFNQNSCKNK